MATEEKVMMRTESDSMGTMEIPETAYWGAQAQRAAENFDVSPLRIPVPFMKALAAIKRSAARINASLGLLEKRIADAILQTTDEIIDEKWNDQFPVDVFQTGSGTS